MTQNNQTPGDHFGKLAAIYFLFLIATVAIGTSVSSIYSRYHIRQTGISRTGTVYDIEHEISTDTDALVFKVKFDYNGKDYEIHNDSRTIDNRYHLNQKVGVVFISDSPEEAIIHDLREESLPPLFLIIGLAILAFAIYLLKAERRFALKSL